MWKLKDVLSSVKRNKEYLMISFLFIIIFLRELPMENHQLTQVQHRAHDQAGLDHSHSSLAKLDHIQRIFLRPKCEMKEFEMFGKKHNLDHRAEHISAYVTKSEIRNYEWMTKVCRPDMHFIDIGCNYGVYSKVIKEQCGCGVTSVDIYLHHLMGTKCVSDSKLVWGAVGHEIEFQEYFIPRVWLNTMLEGVKTPLIKIDVEHSEQLVYDEILSIISNFDEIHIIAEYTPLWWMKDKGVDDPIQTGTFEKFSTFISDLPPHCSVQEVKTRTNLRGLDRHEIRKLSGDQSDMTISCVVSKDRSSSD